MNIPILYEDNHLLIVEKPVNVPVQEDSSKDKDLLTILKEDIKVRYDKPGNVYLGLVHRLDRPVGGVMIFAKTSKAAGRLSDAVRTRKFGKSYICIVHGNPQSTEAELFHYIRKDSRKNQVKVFNHPEPEAKDARLSYKVIASSGGHSLEAIELHTGRTHQIRAQMAFIGHTLVGDVKYGFSDGMQNKHAQIAL